jgi:hypothetical protein
VGKIGWQGEKSCEKYGIGGEISRKYIPGGGNRLSEPVMRVMRMIKDDESNKENAHT